MRVSFVLRSMLAVLIVSRPGRRGRRPRTRGSAPQFYRFSLRQRGLQLVDVVKDGDGVFGAEQFQQFGPSQARRRGDADERDAGLAGAARAAGPGAPPPPVLTPVYAGGPPQ